MDASLLYELALTRVNSIGTVQAKLLVDFFGNAEEIFKASKKKLSAVEGIGEVRAQAIKNFTAFSEMEQEVNFCQKHQINILFLTNNRYPSRLLNCYDAPTVLYSMGNADLNSTKIVSIIGTRSNTEYGRHITETLVAGLKEHKVLVVSGMAFGIDAIAHKEALHQQLPTVGVLAHGLDSMYPSQHKQIAKDMLKNGGLLTEFPRFTKPDKHNFPRRNRIVAGIADATIVIETANKGGSMITAELAYNYNRDLFAVPGKLTDTKSNGCLQLLSQRKANIFLSPEQFLAEMNWGAKPILPKKPRELFVQLSNEEQQVIQILQSKESVSIDELYKSSGLSSSVVASALLSLELQSLILCLPGKMFKAL